MRETWVQSLGQEDPLEKEMATHSSILAWRIPWTEEPGGLYSPRGRKESDTTERLDLTYEAGSDENEVTLGAHVAVVCKRGTHPGNKHTSNHLNAEFSSQTSYCLVTHYFPTLSAHSHVAR